MIRSNLMSGRSGAAVRSITINPAMLWGVACILLVAVLVVGAAIGVSSCKSKDETAGVTPVDIDPTGSAYGRQQLAAARMLGGDVTLIPGQLTLHRDQNSDMTLVLHRSKVNEWEEVGVAELDRGMTVRMDNAFPDSVVHRFKPSDFGLTGMISKLEIVDGALFVDLYTAHTTVEVERAGDEIRLFVPYVIDEESEDDDADDATTLSGDEESISAPAIVMSTVKFPCDIAPSERMQLTFFNAGTHCPVMLDGQLLEEFGSPSFPVFRVNLEPALYKEPIEVTVCENAWAIDPDAGALEITVSGMLAEFDGRIRTTASPDNVPCAGCAPVGDDDSADDDSGEGSGD